MIGEMDDVAVVEGAVLVDPLAVEEGAVGAAQVGQQDATAVALHAGVVTGNALAGYHNITIHCPTDGCFVIIQRMLAARWIC